ncbi:tRNA-splicing endonuclease subunit sen54 [Umbelopsis nana]
MDADNEEGFADYSALKQKIRKGKDVSWQGQKDFEPDESTSQCEKLQASRNAMFEVLAEKRPISGKNRASRLSSRRTPSYKVFGANDIAIHGDYRIPKSNPYYLGITRTLATQRADLVL